MITETGQQISDREAAIDAFVPVFGDILHRLNLILIVFWHTKPEGMRKIAETRRKNGRNQAARCKIREYAVGLHRADVVIKLAGVSAQETASRGQGKTIGSAAALAQSALLAQYNKQPSLVLIDDFGAELDEAHRLRLLHTLLDIGCQVVATSTEPLSGLLN